MSSEIENEYFSDGITEEILNALSKIEGLHVTARTSSFSFKNQKIDIREIGYKLNVSLLLEGSVRKSGDIVRITAQLTNASDGFHVWSETWDRELKDIFIVQDEIASIIAEKINKDISVEVNKNLHIIENIEAIDWYLKGMYLQHKWDLHEGPNIINCFEKAIGIDPDFVNVHIGFCNIYTWLGATGYVRPDEAQTKIGYHIQRILDLDINNPQVYLIIAQRNFWLEWDFPEALKNLNKTLTLQPSNADALKTKALVMAGMGNAGLALDCFFQAERLDPLNEHIHSGIGMIYNYTNENKKAIEYIEKNIQLYPGWYPQYIDKVDVLCKLQRYDEAWETIQMIKKDPNSSISATHLTAIYYAYQEKKQEAETYIELFKEEVKKSGSQIATEASFISQAYILLGEDNKALDFLEYGLEHMATPFLFIKILHYWDSLRNHPRYLKAIKKIKFDDDERLSEEPKKYKKSGISKEKSSEIERKLKKVMENEKAFLNPSLNLSDLAESVEITANQLSYILNEFIGTNFYDYVNTYRLDYFLSLYNENKYKNYTILGIAYDCGFNSKTTFNAFFKKVTGLTPSEYFKNKNRTID